MSSGERGGLQELLKYIRALRKKQIVIPLICCCNVIQGRKAQQLLRLSKVFEVRMPTTDLLSVWLGRAIKKEERGSDLRQLLRGEEHAGNNTDDEEGEEETYAKKIAHHTLFDSIDIYEELVAETKDINLASLLVHQNLLTRIGSGASLKLYDELMEILRFGDKCDFWAFFHQCWPLLNISLEFKCKLLNFYLQKIPMPTGKRIPSPEQLEYTWVLTKQSSLFNAWKEICIRHDTQNIPIHYVCDTVGAEAPKLIFTDPKEALTVPASRL
jgi:hypothetical protein